MSTPTTQFSKKRHILLFILLISLLVHLVLVILFVGHAFVRSTTAKAAAAKKHEPAPIFIDLQKEEPAQILQGPSEFGAPPVEEAETDTPAIEQEEQTKQETPPEAPSKAERQPEEEVTFETTPELDLKKLALQNLLKPKQPTKQTSTMQPAPTSLQLPPGNVYSEDHGGNSPISQAGDPSKTPSLKELKYLSYQQRMLWHIQKASRALYKTEPLPHGQIEIIIEIAKDGTLRSYKETEPSENEAFNNLIRHLFKQAAPFPPIPDHFKVDTLQVLCGAYTAEERFGAALRGGFRFLNVP